MTATASGEGMQVSPDLNEKTSSSIVSLKSAANPATDERVPCFTIDGTPYTILTKPRFNDALEYTHLARTRGADIAIDFMLETLLGEDGYGALRRFRDLTEDDLAAVINAASRIMTGAVDAPKGKRKSASRKSAG